MKPRITVITLGVDDLERALAFYRDGLGFATEGIIGKEFEHGAVVFIDLQPGLKLALWPRKSLAHDSGLALAAPSATAKKSPPASYCRRCFWCAIQPTARSSSLTAITACARCTRSTRTS